MRRIICLLTLVTSLGLQTHQTAGKVDDALNRVTHLSKKVLRRLEKLRIQDRFEIYLEVHLLTVQVITNVSEPILSEMKERAKERNMRTLRMSKRCLADAEEKVSKLSQQVYNHEVGDCSKDFVAMYQEATFTIVEESYKCAQVIGRLLHVMKNCKSSDDEATCISRETRIAQQTTENLELSAESVARELHIDIQKASENLHSCLESNVTPLLLPALSAIKQEFWSCVE